MGEACRVSLCSVAILVMSGVEAAGIRRAPQEKARLSSVLFWCVYGGGALIALFGPPFRRIERRGREIKLTLTSAILVHVGLVAWFYGLSGEFPLSTTAFALVAADLMWTRLITARSLSGMQDALGAASVRRLCVVEIEYIAFALLCDLTPNRFHNGAKGVLDHPSCLVSVTSGTILRPTAWAQRNTLATKAGR